MYVWMSTAGGLSSVSFRWECENRRQQQERFSLSLRSPLFFKTMLSFFFSRTFRYCILQIHISSASMRRERERRAWNFILVPSFLLCSAKKKRERKREKKKFDSSLHIPEISLSVSALRSIVIVHWCKNETKQSNRTEQNRQRDLLRWLIWPSSRKGIVNVSLSPAVCLCLSSRKKSIDGRQPSSNR